MTTPFGIVPPPVCTICGAQMEQVLIEAEDGTVRGWICECTEELWSIITVGYYSEPGKDKHDFN